MPAIALCLGLFAYWWLIGYAATMLLHRRGDRLERVLIAPTVGLAVHVIALFTFARFGWPVGKFATPVAAGLLLPAFVLLGVRRGPFPLKQALPFFAIVFAAFLLTGWPMKRFGFDWMSYCNDDMAQYSLAADRFLHEGYLKPPTHGDLVEGRGYGGDFWFMYHAMKSRMGAELVLASAAALTGLSTHQIFMPVIIAFHLGLILAGAVLARAAGFAQPEDDGVASNQKDDVQAYRGEPSRPAGRAIQEPTGIWINAGTLTAALLAISPLTTLGALYQLIAQVAGLALLAVTALLVLRPWTVERAEERKTLVLTAVLAAIVGSALMIVYPEVAPFAGMALVGYVIVGLVRRQIRILHLAIPAGSAAGVTLLLTRGYAFDLVRYLSLQSAQAKSASTPDAQALLFPYYVVPEGLASLWGFLRIAEWEGVSTVGFRVVAGAALLLLTVVAVVVLCWRGRPVAFVAAAMLGLGGLLFVNHAGFGLFKLAMFIQPFLIGSAVGGWVLLGRRWTKRLPRFVGCVAIALPPMVLAGLQWRAQRGYVSTSYGFGSGFAEIRDPSNSRVASEFAKVVAEHPESDVIVSDSMNMVLGKFQALYTRGRSLVFPSRQFFTVIDRAEADTKWKSLRPDQAKYATAIKDARMAAFYPPRSGMPVLDPEKPGLTNNFFQSELGLTRVTRDHSNTLLIETGPRQTIFNRRTFAADPRANFAPVPFASAINHAVFIDSDLGRPYYLYDGTDMPRGVFPIEPDPKFFAGESMAGVGRYMLLQVLNPTDTVRVGVTLTCSYMGDGENLLPANMAIVGETRKPFGVTGRGSMRLFSPPVRPKLIDGRAYVMLDMGTDGLRLGPNRVGLTKLYGSQFSVDRKLVGFARDISIISDTDWHKLAPPTTARDFTPGKQNALRSPDLEYAGLYEDGWLSDQTCLRLTQTPRAEQLVIRVMVPAELGADYRPEVTVLVDGKENWRQTVSAGEFVVQRTIPGSADATVRDVRVRFSSTRKLPAPDNRPVGGLLVSAGFERGDLGLPPGAVPPSRIEGWGFDASNPLRNPGLKHEGVWEDGWIGADSSFLMTQPHANDELVLRVVVPGNLTPDFKAEMTVLLDGREIARQPVSASEYTIRRPATGGADGAIRDVRIRFSATQPLPKPDDRAIGARLSLLAFEPPRKP